MTMNTQMIINMVTGVWVGLWPLPFLIALTLRLVLANQMPLNTEYRIQTVAYLVSGFVVSLFVAFTNPIFSASMTFILIAGLGIATRKLSHLPTAIEIIRNSNIIYKNTESGNRGVISGEGAAIGPRETKIKVHRTLKNSRIIDGFPVLGLSITFKMGNTSTPEEVAKVKGQLIRYFPNYIFDTYRQGSNYKITAQANKGKLKPLPFPVNLSKTLPFYAIPLGAIDGSSKRRAVETPYIWLMNSDYDLYKRKDLTHAKFLSNDAAPHGLIVGGTRGGKSVLLYSLILHLAITNKADLYIIDPKGTEFKEFAGYPFVKGYCGPSIFEAQDIMERFLTAQDKRYYSMSSLGVKNLAAANDRVELGHNWIIDGWGIDGNAPMKIKTSDGNERTTSLNELNMGNGGFEVFVPAKTWNNPDGQWVKATSDNTQHGGSYEFRPMVMICDEYSKLVESTNGREEQRKAMDFQSGVDLITKLGGAADIHLVLATQSANMNMFPTSVRNNIHFRNICGWVETSVSNGVIGSEQGSSIPKIPGSYLAYIRNDTVFYRGYFTSEKDIKKVFSNALGSKDKDSEGSKKRKSGYSDVNDGYDDVIDTTTTNSDDENGVGSNTDVDNTDDTNNTSLEDSIANVADVENDNNNGNGNDAANNEAPDMSNIDWSFLDGSSNDNVDTTVIPTPVTAPVSVTMATPAPATIPIPTETPAPVSTPTTSAIPVPTLTVPTLNRKIDLRTRKVINLKALRANGNSGSNSNGGITTNNSNGATSATVPVPHKIDLRSLRKH